jgi:hypothetical protein
MSAQIEVPELPQSLSADQSSDHGDLPFLVAVRLPNMRESAKKLHLFNANWFHSVPGVSSYKTNFLHVHS